MSTGMQSFFMGTVNRDIKLRRLDRRWSHSHLFPYIVQISGADTYRIYQDAMLWCYEQWGMTVDVETYRNLRNFSQLRAWDFQFSTEWAYLDKYGDHRIYLTEAAASWFSLGYLKIS